MTAADCWADLEAKASDLVAARAAYDTPPLGAAQATWQLLMAAEEAFEAAATPATILKLIEAARHSQPGAEGAVAPRVVGTIAHVSHGRSELGALVYAALSPQQPATSTDEKVGR